MKPHSLTWPTVGVLALLPVVWALLAEPGPSEPERSRLEAPKTRLPVRERPESRSAFLAIPLIPAAPAIAVLPDSSGLRRKTFKLDTLRSEPLDSAARAEGEEALRRLREGWRQKCERNRGSTCPGRRSQGRFANEWDCDYTEVRLFALGFPELAETWARDSVDNPDSPGWDRFRALGALCLLAKLEVGAAESVLVRHFRDGEVWIRRSVQSSLCFKKKRRSFRLQLAREGEYSGIEALSLWADPEALEVCQDWVSKREEGDSRNEEAIRYAQCALFRLEALSAGAWQVLAQRTIEGQECAPFEKCWMGDHHFDWAVRVALERHAPWLEKSLRARIAGILEGGWFRFEAPPSGIEDRSNWIADAALLALAEQGSPLDEKESAYLQYYGIACEPRKRLAEILEEKRYPR